jgi:hypothetical protein
MTIAAWLVAMVGPVMARALASLGLTVITMTGLTVALAALKAQLISSIGGLPAAAVQLGGLFGIWECIGIVLGALTFVVAWNGSSGFWRFAKAA